MEDVKKVSQKPNESHLDRIYKRLDDIDKKLEHIQTDAKINHTIYERLSLVIKRMTDIELATTKLAKPWYKR